MTSKGSTAFQDAIAILGVGCRLPGGVHSDSDLWELLSNAKSTQSDFPKERLNIDTWYHPSEHRPGSVNAKGGYFLSHDDEFRQFEPGFFGINAMEAESMDPQQRKLAETVYECFESAGQRLEDLAGSNTGCFVGNFTQDASFDAWKDLEYVRPYQTTGVGMTILSNRINFLFNLKGPSMTIDTACSSTMYALHFACQSLRSGDCSAAIVGGTNLVFGLEQHIGSSELGALSPTSTCHTFDEAADGYGRGDAIGSLLLRTLPEAIRRRDPIRGVIRGSSINANGRSSGISHPSAHQQEAVIRRAYASAGLPLDQTGYFECHGTGTAVGDPIEVQAIGNVFKACHSQASPLLLGSVKTNVGHGEAASTIASVIKTMLVLEKGEVPATVGIQSLNPTLNLLDGALEICRTQTPWSRSGLTYRRASVNSFGYGGANAHVIIDGASCFLADLPLPTPTSVLSPPGDWFLLPFSAHSEAALQKNVAAIRERVARDDKIAVQDLAYTLSHRRTQHSWRTFRVACVDSDFTAVSVPPVSHRATTKSPTLTWIFTGQGAQWPRMGVDLVERFPLVRSTLQRLDEVLARCFMPPNWNIMDILCEMATKSQIHLPTQSQTVCTALQIALVTLLWSWGSRPIAVVGHSSGEIAAAFAAGLLSADDAILVAYLRGVAVTRQQRRGAMLAVGWSPDEATAFLASCPDYSNSDVVVACFNGPRSVTLSGTEPAIEALAVELAARGVFHVALKTGRNAYHSWLMAAAGEEYQALLLRHFPGMPQAAGPDLDPNRPDNKPVMFSSFTGNAVKGALPLSYWRQNLLSPVRFDEAVAALLRETPAAHLIALEIGPHSALATPFRDIVIQHDRQDDVSYLSTLKRNSDGVLAMLQLAGDLYLNAYPIHLHKINGYEDLHVVVDLPPYQWTYGASNLWHQSRLLIDITFRKYPRHDLLGSKLPGCCPQQPTWRNMVQLKHLPWLRDHVIAGSCVFPGAGYVAMALEAASQLLDRPISDFSLQDMAIKAALRLEDNAATEVITVASAVVVDSDPCVRFNIQSVVSGHWTEHASGMVRSYSHSTLPRHECVLSITNGNVGNSHHNDTISLCEKGGRWGVNSNSFDSMWSEAMTRMGLVYGPTFRVLSGLSSRASTREAFARVRVRSTASIMPHESFYPVHPTVIDAALRVIVIAAHQGKSHTFIKPFIPTYIRKLTVLGTLSECADTVTVRATGERRGPRNIAGTALLTDSVGTPFLHMEIELTSLDGYDVTSQQQAIMRHPYTRLTWKPDFDRLEPQQLSSLLPCCQDSEQIAHQFSQMEEICTLILLNDYRRVPTGPSTETLPFHMQKFSSWIESQGCQVVARLPASHTFLGMTYEEREQRIAEIASEDGDNVPEIALIARLHAHVLDIVYGRIEPLEVMIQNDTLSQVYERGLSGKGAYDKLSGVLQLLGHKTARLRILEIGAGSGGATIPALKALHGDTAFPAYEEYVFTDVSTSFLSRAKDRFHNMKNITYGILDIEKSAIDQGYTEEDFDIIIAANVLHATASIVETLHKCKKLLRPGGRLVLVETVQHILFTGLLVGQLPGYWLGTADDRPDGPFISAQEWDKRLRQAGFSGADHVLYDYQPPLESTAVIVSHKQGQETELPMKVNGHHASTAKREPVYLIYLNQITDLLLALEEKYVGLGLDPHRVQLHEVSKMQDRGPRVVVLVEIEQPLWFPIDQRTLAAIQYLVRLHPTVTWVTEAGVICGEVPEKSLVTGIVRSIMIEEPSFRVATIDLSPTTPSPSRSANLVCGVEQRFSAEPLTDDDYNFAEVDGILYISRNLFENKENIAFHRLHNVELESRLCPDDVALHFQHVGTPQSFYFAQKSRDDVAPNHVLVDLESFVLDTSTVGMLKGLPHFPYHALEYTGTVRATGASVTRCKLGDKIVCFGPSAVQTTVSTPEEMCWVLEAAESLQSSNSSSSSRRTTMPSLTSTKSSPEMRPWKQTNRFTIGGQLKVFCLALHIIDMIAPLSRHKQVLVFMPGDPLGHAVSQILSAKGCKVSAVHGSLEERTSLQAIHGVETIAVDDMRAQKAQFDAVISHRLSSVTDYDQIRPSGTLVLVLSAGAIDSLPPLDGIIARGVAFRCIDSMKILQEDLGLLSSYVMRLSDLTLHQRLISIPITQFPLSDLPQAIEHVEKRVHYGITVVERLATTMIPLRQQPDSVSFDTQSSYIMVGCLGGLGRVITIWMISRGARDLVFLSRSGADKPEAASLIAELEEMKLVEYPNLTWQIIRGDVSDASAVDAAIESACHPIKGVVQAAMVLRESLFDSMTADTWNSAVGPKVLGTRHLHEKTLNMDLDFFVMTSTILSVVGAATQSNYAAGNAYMDHLARHRHSQGLQATSLSIGMVVEAGHVEEHSASEAALRRNGMYGIPIDEFLENFEVACRRKDMSLPPLDIYDPAAVATIITGLDPTRIIRNTSKTFWQRDARLRHFLVALERCHASADAAPGPQASARIESDPAAALKEAAQQGGREGVNEKILQLLVERVAGLTMISASEVDPSMPLAQYGMDSMIGAELRAWLQRKLGVDIPFLVLLDQHLTFQHLAQRALGLLSSEILVVSDAAGEAISR